ncbi:hypothetical protein [Leyella stercorea]|uniref:hypothetical protein n=1 Tax=Leyella stercorea TaxID=363265 RepID=UPI002430A541|nr:hypothetical protein [Leyella stercorea]
MHGWAQIRRVWHPCHTHAANQTIFPQNPQKFLTQDILPQNTQKRLAQGILPQIADIHRLGGYGILPYPRSH